MATDGGGTQSKPFNSQNMICAYKSSSNTCRHYSFTRYEFQLFLFFHIEQGGSFLVKTSFQLFFSSHFHLCVRMCACVVNWSEYFSKMNTYCRIGSNLCIVQHSKFVIFFIPFSFFSFKIRVNDSIYVHFCHDVGIPAP